MDDRAHVDAHQKVGQILRRIVPKSQPPAIAMLRPAATKLISAGMALQEQNGVTTPKPVNTPPKPSRSTAAESGCTAAWAAPGCARSINAVAEYIEVFYNGKRMHPSTGYRTPRQPSPTTRWP